MDSKYSKIDDKSDVDSQPSEDFESQENLLTKGSTGLPRSHPKRNVLCYSAAMVATAGFSLAAGFFGGRYSTNADRICPSHVQKYSPILNEVDTGMYPVRFNGSFKKENIYRQDASPEVDAAWMALGSDYKVIIVPEEEGEKAGLVKPGQVRVSQKYGGGFPANVEVLHQLHCLNLLRKATWYNYDYYVEKGQGPFANEERILKYHVSHCFDTLRQQLICQPDTAFLGQIWWDTTAPKAFIDFDNEHQCKNFEAIRQWAEDHQLHYLLENNLPSDFLEAPDPDVVAPELP